MTQEPNEPSGHVQDWYHHFNPYRLFRTLPPQGGNEIHLDPEWERFWIPTSRDTPLFTKGSCSSSTASSNSPTREAFSETNIFTASYRNPRPPGSKAAEIFTHQDLARST